MRDAATRLGTGASGTADVMADGFFAPLDFALVMQRANPNPKPKPNPNPKPKPNPNQVISLEVVNIIDVRSKTRDIGGASAFQYHVQVSSLAMIERLFEAVAALDDVVHVRRGDMLHMLHDSPDGFWAHAAERPAAEEQP